MAKPATSTRIEEEYIKRHPISKSFYEKSLRVFPRGVTHDGRFMKPFPLYCAKAQGSRKWDVDGNEYIDYWMGHGALILGHQHPRVTEAVLEQVRKGTHYGACHELEIEWAEKITGLVPSARDGLVEFTSSGTEATLMALRLARAYAGRDVVLKFAGHFHGWHDYVILGAKTPFEEAGHSGIPEGVMGSVRILPPNNVEAVEEELKRGDVAGVILEPGGAAMGTIPPSTAFLKKLQKLTAQNEVALIFDEVVTGFRDAPGGSQEAYGVLPDITVLGKIVAGGYPAAAVTGIKKYLNMLAFREDPTWNRMRKIPHYGTFNANPLCAAAGNTCLGIIAEGKVNTYVNRLGVKLTRGFNDAFQDNEVKGMAWAPSPSIVQVGFGVENQDLRVSTFDEASRLFQLKDNPVYDNLAKTMANRGVHLMGSRAILSSAHTEGEVEKTIEAFADSLQEMRGLF